MIRKRKQKNGQVSYQARVMLGGSLTYETFKTYQEAEAWVNELRYRRSKNLEFSHGPVSIEQMFAAYLNFAESKGRSLGTLKAAKQRYQSFLKPYFHGNDMRQVEVQDIENLLKIIRDQGKSASTVNRVRALLRVCYSIAIAKRLFGGVFTFNPFDAIEPALEEKKAIQYWNKDQLNQFLNENQESHYYPFFLTVLSTGLRIGEAVAIQAEQIDKSIDLLTIDRQFVEAANEIRMRTKGKEIRHIALVPDLAQVLYPIMESQGPIFTKIDGSPLTPNYVRQFVLPNACKQAKVKELNPHGLRHTFSAHYLMDGGKIWDLSKILGHSSTKITESYYAHFDLEHIRARMNVVSRRGNVIAAKFVGVVP